MTARRARGLGVVCLALAWLGVAAGCGRDRATSEPERATSEPATRGTGGRVQVHRGRTIEVHCAARCEALEAELTALHRDCRLDPRSTPRRVSTDEARVEAACCIETESVALEACGDADAIARCVASWSAYCQQATAPLGASNPLETGGRR